MEVLLALIVLHDLVVAAQLGSLLLEGEVAVQVLMYQVDALGLLRHAEVNVSVGYVALIPGAVGFLRAVGNQLAEQRGLTVEAQRTFVRVVPGYALGSYIGGVAEVLVQQQVAQAGGVLNVFAAVGHEPAVVHAAPVAGIDRVARSGRALNGREQAVFIPAQGGAGLGHAVLGAPSNDYAQASAVGILTHGAQILGGYREAVLQYQALAVQLVGVLQGLLVLLVHKQRADGAVGLYAVVIGGVGLEEVAYPDYKAVVVVLGEGQRHFVGSVAIAIHVSFKYPLEVGFQLVGGGGHARLILGHPGHVVPRAAVAVQAVIALVDVRQGVDAAVGAGADQLGRRVGRKYLVGVGRQFRGDVLAHVYEYALIGVHRHLGTAQSSAGGDDVGVVARVEQQIQLGQLVGRRRSDELELDAGSVGDYLGGLVLFVAEVLDRRCQGLEYGEGDVLTLLGDARVALYLDGCQRGHACYQHGQRYQQGQH